MEFWLPSANKLDIWTMKTSVGMPKCVRTHEAAS
jgi:hypothetical protein